jgi:hypothetical protein
MMKAKLSVLGNVKTDTKGVTGHSYDNSNCVTKYLGTAQY